MTKQKSDSIKKVNKISSWIYPANFGFLLGLSIIGIVQKDFPVAWWKVLATIYWGLNWAQDKLLKDLLGCVDMYRELIEEMETQSKVLFKLYRKGRKTKKDFIN